jgi:hypothetical protein
MKISRTYLAAVLFMGTLGAFSHAVAEDGVLMQEPLTAESYCHEKFPAIRERTLDEAQPSLKRSSTGDVIDFYGPCDENPVGKDQVEEQKIEAQHRWANEYED